MALMRPVLSLPGHQEPSRGAAKRGYAKDKVEKVGRGTGMNQRQLAKLQSASEGAQRTPGMYKFMIFAIDLGSARAKGKKLPTSLEEFKCRICESLGVDSNDQRVEAIFAGYEGVGRQAIDTDAEFKDFMDTVEKVPESARRDEEEESELVKDLRQQILSLEREAKRAGERHEAERKQLKDEISAYEAQLLALRQQIEDMRQQFQRKLLKEQAARQQVEQRLERQIAETEKIKDQLAKVSEVYEQKMREQKEKFEAEKRSLMTTIKSLKDDLAKKEAYIEELEEIVRQLREKVAALEAELVEKKALIEKLEGEVRRLDLLSKQQKRINDELHAKYEEVRAKLAKYEDTAEATVEEPDPSKFEWTITNMSQRLAKWERGRSIHSPEFCLELADDLMIEFFPRGDHTSYEGFCSIKLRVPNGTKLRWSLQIGEMAGGPRCDLYERHLWWCRSGIVWNNFCTEYDLLRQVDENDTLTIVLELHPMAEGFSMQDPIDVGKDPFAHRHSQMLPHLRRGSDPSVGEQLLNPQYAGGPREARAAVFADAGSPRSSSRTRRRPKQMGRAQSETNFARTWDGGAWRGSAQGLPPVRHPGSR